jgi:hypothetical protein
VSEEETGPIETDSKSENLSQEEAYDKIAEEHGVDENGDEISTIDDDEPLLEGDNPIVNDDPDAPLLDQPNEPAQDLPLAAVEALAPHTWKQEWKESFDKITDPGMKAAILEQNQNMGRAFTQKMTELATIKRDLGGVQGSLQPHMERLQRAGITPDVAIQRSLAWDAHIQRNPQQGLMDMAQAYGVDLAQVAQPEQEYLTPTERRLQQDAQNANHSVQQVQAQMAQWQENQRQADWNHRASNAHGMLEHFMNAKDESGNLLHPYIEHVAPVMTQLIQNQMAPDLETAYQMAETWSPDIQAARQRTRQSEQVTAAQVKAAKVRKASGGIVSKPNSSGKAPRTMEQQLEAAYANHQANA